MQPIGSVVRIMKSLVDGKKNPISSTASESRADDGEAHHFHAQPGEQLQVACYRAVAEQHHPPCWCQAARRRARLQRVFLAALRSSA